MLFVAQDTTSTSRFGNTYCLTQKRSQILVISHNGILQTKNKSLEIQRLFDKMLVMMCREVGSTTNQG